MLLQNSLRRALEGNENEDLEDPQSPHLVRRLLKTTLGAVAAHG